MPSRWPAYLSNDLSAKIIAMRVRESEGLKFELKILRVLNGKNSCKQTCDLMQRDATESMTMKIFKVLVYMSGYQRMRCVLVTFIFVFSVPWSV